MKNSFALIIVFCILAAALGGCAQGAGTAEPVESASAESSAEGMVSASPTAAEPETGKKSQGFRMVSDGSFIYYSQFDEPGLRKISTDLSEEVLLADEDCTYLCLAGDMLYYAVPGSGIWQMKTDGSDRRQLEIADDVNGLCYADGTLYYLQGGSIYGFNISSGAKDGEDMGAASYSQLLRDDQYCSSLIVTDGKIYYTSSVDTTTTLYRMDAAGGEAEALLSGVGADFSIEGGRLYYLEEDEPQDNNVNIRICSVDLSGNDRKMLLEEMNAAAYFAVCGTDLYFTRWQTGGPDNFEDNYLCHMDLKSCEVTPMYPDYAIGYLEAAGGYIWFDNYSYDTQATSDYWGEADGSRAMMLDDLRPETQRSEYLGEYVEPYGPGESYLYIKTDELSACYKLVRMDGTVEFEKLMTPNSEETVSFPCGRYTLKIAKGSKWLGDDAAFGETGEYSTTDVFKFKKGLKYEISAGAVGNISTDDAAGFLE